MSQTMNFEEYKCVDCGVEWVTNEGIPKSNKCPICRGEIDIYYQPIERVECPFCIDGEVEDRIQNIGEITMHQLCNGTGKISVSEFKKIFGGNNEKVR